MKSTHFFLTLAILGSLFAAPAAAKDKEKTSEALEFLHLMQTQGFADVASEYLDGLKSDPQAPAEIMAIWDLEKAKSLREQAKLGGYHADDAQRFNDQAKALMDQFIKAHPDMPEAIQAAAEYSAEIAMQAQYDVFRAAYETDAAKKADLLAKARAAFEKIRPRFAAAVETSATEMHNVSSHDKPAKKEARHIDWGENRKRLAIVDYYLAQTDPDVSKQASEYQAVGKEFDNIFQDFRANEDDDSAVFLACMAHYWNARVLQQLGNLKEAKEIYDEVMANDIDESSLAGGAPPAAGVAARVAAAKNAAKADPIIDNFFCDVEQHFLEVLFGLKKDAYYTEVRDYRKTRSARKYCAGYQGLSWDLVQKLMADGADDSGKTPHKAEVLAILAEMVRVVSPYQRDAIELRRKLNPHASEEDSFDSLLVDADKALEKKDWGEAADLYGKALAAAEPVLEKDRKDSRKPVKEKQNFRDRVAAVRNAVVACTHNQALDLYQSRKAGDREDENRKANEAVDLILKVLKDDEDNQKTAAAGGAAVFTLNVRYFQYQAAPERTEEEKTAKAALLSKVIALAKWIKATWTGNEQGDSARIVLLRIALSKGQDASFAAANAEAKALEDKAAAAAAKGDPDKAKAALAEADAAAAEAKTAAETAARFVNGADAIFNEINPASHEYPRALTFLGFEHWQKYRMAKRAWDEKSAGAPPDAATQAKFDYDRNQALEFTKKAIAVEDKPRPAGTPMSKELRGSMLLLAEIYAERNDNKSAVGTYQALVDDVLADPKTKSLDDDTLRIFNGAVQAYLQLDGMMDKASAVTQKLLELGPDRGPVNVAIVNLARRLEIKRKKAVADADSRGEGAADSGGEAAAAQQAINDLESKVMVDLSKREELSGQTMVWIVQTLGRLNNRDAGTADAAIKLATNIKRKAASDDQFNNQVAKAMPYLRSLSSDLEADRGNYDGAVRDVRALIDENPRALEPRVKYAQYLTRWAESNPDKYDAAIDAWDTIRSKLERIVVESGEHKGEKKYIEYYDAVYNECLSFAKAAERKKDDSYARKGLAILSPILLVDPKIMGPLEAKSGPKRDREWSMKLFGVGDKLADIVRQPHPQRPRTKSRAN